MKKATIFFVYIIGLNFFTFSQTVSIGSQVWMTKNLDVSTFRNGEKIPEAKTEEEWSKAGEEGRPVWCKYPFEATDKGEHGKLYNWYAIIDPRGLAPKGWKIPSEMDWNQLIKFLGGESAAGNKIKSAKGWFDGGEGTNESGFNGLPSGYRSDFGEGDIGAFYSGGELGGWWSSSNLETNDLGDAQYFQLYYSSNEAILLNCFKSDGFSVRCIKD